MQEEERMTQETHSDARDCQSPGQHGDLVRWAGAHARALVQGEGKDAGSADSRSRVISGRYFTGERPL